MALLETPPNQTPRSIGPAYHERVWQLHQDGLGAPQIAAALAAAGCRTTRHSVRRLLQQLRWAQARERRLQAFIEDTKKDRVTAFTARCVHQEALSDLCDDLAIAARKQQHERVLTLSRAGRVLLRTVEQYERMYQAGLEREFAAMAMEPKTPPVPTGVPVIEKPVEGQESRAYELYPNGTGAPNSTVELIYDGQPQIPALCNSGGQWIAGKHGLPAVQHTIEVGYSGSTVRSAPVHFTILGCLLLMAVGNLSCGGVGRKPGRVPAFSEGVLEPASPPLPRAASHFARRSSVQFRRPCRAQNERGSAPHSDEAMIRQESIGGRPSACARIRGWHRQHAERSPSRFARGTADGTARTSGARNERRRAAAGVRPSPPPPPGTRNTPPLAPPQKALRTPARGRASGFSGPARIASFPRQAIPAEPRTSGARTLWQTPKSPETTCPGRTEDASADRKWPCTRLNGIAKASVLFGKNNHGWRLREPRGRSVLALRRSVPLRHPARHEEASLLRVTSRRLLLWPAAVALLLAACHSEPTKPDLLAGKEFFERHCAMCHSTGTKNKKGPGLANIVGRKAASMPGFSYSPALHSRDLTWTPLNLNRFLAAPGDFIPGTTMPIAVPVDQDRHDLVAYLETLHGQKTTALPDTGIGQPPPPAKPGLRAGKAAFGDFRDDGPGVQRRITVADLPPPFATPSSSNGPRVVPRPKDAHLHVPPGFQVKLFASGLTNPRTIQVAPCGDIFVAETAANRIRVIRAADGAASLDRIEIFTSGLDQPFGMAFYPPGPNPQWLYVANLNSIVRFPYRNLDLHVRGIPETVVPKLADSTGGHPTRDLAFSPDGKRMFVSVGSASNVGQELPHWSAEQIHAWVASHVLGAAWDNEDHRADVLVFDPDGRNEHVFATGIRNCGGGLAVDHATGDVWCSTNERDGLGDNLVPDYVTRVREGAFYGWPWYYLGAHEDPRQKGVRPDLAGHVTVPDVLLQAHSAPLEMTFYDGAQFPTEYRGSVFVALHGSWNRSRRTGYKVVRLLMKQGVPTGEYEDFLTGFALDERHVWGRPVGVAVAHDGSLLVTEDGNGTLWRVSYSGSKPSGH